MQSGKSFEIEIKRMLESELQDGQLGLASRSTKIFHRKGYFSKDRGGKIVFDVALEIYRSSASEPWLIWVWECKDEGRPVAVAEVEEFASKLQQIGSHGVKGTLASRNGFQRGAVEYAKSKHIGLLRLLADGSIIRILQAVHTPDYESVLFGLTELDTRSLYSMTYGLTPSGVGADSFAEFLQIELAKGD